MPLHSETSASDVVSRLAARHITWNRIREKIAEAQSHAHPASELDHHVGPFITISGQAEAGARELGSLVASGLGWPVVDQELLDAVAGKLNLDRGRSALLDEIEANWVRDVLGDFMPHEAVSRDSYVGHLGEVIKLLGMYGQVVLVGHGAPFFLPRERGLRVRVVASMRDREARLAQRERVDRKKAGKLLARHDRARREFCERYFSHDGESPELYDLVVNASSLPMTSLAQVVVDALEARTGGGVSTDAEQTA